MIEHVENYLLFSAPWQQRHSNEAVSCQVQNMVTDRVYITLTQTIVDDKNVNGLVGRLEKFTSEKSIQTFSASGNLVGLKYYHML